MSAQVSFLLFSHYFTECCVDAQNPRWQSNCYGRCDVFSFSAGRRWMSRGEGQRGPNLWHRPVFQSHHWCTATGRWFDRSCIPSPSLPFCLYFFRIIMESWRGEKNSLGLFSGSSLSVFPTKSSSLSYFLGGAERPLKMWGSMGIQ